MTNKELYFDKQALLIYLREQVEEQVDKIKRSSIKKGDKSKKVNTLLKGIKSILLNELYILKLKGKISQLQLLEANLLIDYCINIVMLESRNKVWEYEYMAFARRIGELWEPFAKIPFEYPIKELKLVDPKSFDDFRDNHKSDVYKVIDNALSHDKVNSKFLKEQFELVWSFVDSGSIQLKLDLHFEQSGFSYNVDYKSGFSSNEKGNTNRLLTVGSIYKMISNKNKQLIFVRQNEEDNNHYLQTLKNSGLYDVYCGEKAYDKINEFTGYNIKVWIKENMTWEKDISEEFKQYLNNNDLIKYLKW